MHGGRTLHVSEEWLRLWRPSSGVDCLILRVLVEEDITAALLAIHVYAAAAEPRLVWDVDWEGWAAVSRLALRVACKILRDGHERDASLRWHLLAD